MGRMSIESEIEEAVDKRVEASEIPTAEAYEWETPPETVESGDVISIDFPRRRGGARDHFGVDAIDAKVVSGYTEISGSDAPTLIVDGEQSGAATGEIEIEDREDDRYTLKVAERVGYGLIFKPNGERIGRFDGLQRAKEFRESVEAQDPHGVRDMEPQERSRINNFVCKSTLGGGVHCTHLHSPISSEIHPHKAEVVSRQENFEIQVDHDPTLIPESEIESAINGAVETQAVRDDILAQVPGEEALEGVDSYEDLTRPAQEVVDRIDMTHLRDRLEGREDGTLRSSKPTAQGDTGLEQYVWRMARFHSGDDPKMPVTAAWWLNDWLEAENIDAEVSGIMDKPGKQITAILGAAAQAIVASFGRNTTGGLEIWQDALYGR